MTTPAKKEEILDALAKAKQARGKQIPGLPSEPTDWTLDPESPEPKKKRKKKEPILGPDGKPLPKKRHVRGGKSWKKGEYPRADVVWKYMDDTFNEKSWGPSKTVDYTATLEIARQFDYGQPHQEDWSGASEDKVWNEVIALVAEEYLRIKGYEKYAPPFSEIIEAYMTARGINEPPQDRAKRRWPG